jgi:hypothetical protein
LSSLKYEHLKKVSVIIEVRRISPFCIVVVDIKGIRGDPRTTRMIHKNF